MPPNLRTDPTLLDALKKAAAYKPSERELEQQRISFVMGTVKTSNSITRAEVRKILAQHEGKSGVS